MLRFIPMFITMGIFAAIGVYWVFMTRHFLKWTRKYGESFQSPVDGRQPQTVAVEEHSALTYARMQTENGIGMLTWGIRLIGGAIAGFALIMIGMMVYIGL